MQLRNLTVRVISDFTVVLKVYFVDSTAKLLVTVAVVRLPKECVWHFLKYLMNFQDLRIDIKEGNASIPFVS